MKKCSRCRKKKDRAYFSKRKKYKDGLDYKCKDCSRIEREQYAESIKKHLTVWRKDHPEQIKQYRQKWKNNNPEKVKESNRLVSNRRRASLRGRLGGRMSCSIGSSLKNKSKNNNHWESLVGYTIKQLKTHLEKHFVDGMTWEKYGKNGWEIDHIIPKSAFNYEKPEDIDFKRCWALKNLQPLWRKNNRSKWNKVSKPFQPNLLI